MEYMSTDNFYAFFCDDLLEYDFQRYEGENVEIMLAPLFQTIFDDNTSHTPNTTSFTNDTYCNTSEQQETSLNENNNKSNLVFIKCS
jgi:hypothetical protein